MSESTKKALAVALKNVMKVKSFDKIIVQDITKECGINRQTFYYHFQDRFDLICWIYYNEVFLPVIEKLTEDNYSESILLMLNIMINDREFYKNALYISIDNRFMEYIYSIFESIVEIISKQQKESIDVCFYAHGLLGIVTAWIKRDLDYPVDELANKITNYLESIK